MTSSPSVVLESERPSAVDRKLGWYLSVVTLVGIGSGLAYSLWWPAVVRHQSYYWLYPGDIWGTVRAAHWIGWGGFSFVYSSRTSLVTLPGFHVLLTPVVMLASKLGLSETAPGLLAVPKPSSWLLIDPFSLAFLGLAVFGLDRLARELATRTTHRRILAITVVAVCWPVVTMWGHPEDVAALGLLGFALSFLVRERLTPVAWLLGAALAMQLYVVAVVPIFLAVASRHRWMPLLARAAVLPGFLFVAVVIPNPRATLHALFQQPNWPSIDFPTPWVSLAPSLGHGAVAAGPGRLVGLALAIALAFPAYRHRHEPTTIVWLVGLTLAVRCLSEAVMDPYYVLPAIAVALVLAARSGWTSFFAAILVGGGLTYLTYLRPGEWPYWLEMAAAFLLLSLMTMPHPPRVIVKRLQRVLGSPSRVITASAKSEVALPSDRSHEALLDIDRLAASVSSRSTP